MPAKLKPRVFGCFWKNSFTSSKNGSLDSFNKDQIVHNQLMKILEPYCCVLLSDDNGSDNYDEEVDFIDTSYSINIRVSINI